MWGARRTSAKLLMNLTFAPTTALSAAHNVPAIMMLKVITYHSPIEFSLWIGYMAAAIASNTPVHKRPTGTANFGLCQSELPTAARPTTIMVRIFKA